MCRDVAFGDDHGNRDDDHDDSRGKFRGERFSENRNPENDGSNGFQSSEDCCRSGADILDGFGCRHEGYGGREEGKRYDVSPQEPFGGNDQLVSGQNHGDEYGESEYQYIEGNLYGSHLLESGLVDPDDVACVGEGGGHDEQNTDRVECNTVVSLVEHGYTAQCDEDAEYGEPRDFLFEEEGHDDGYHDWVDEQYGRGDSGIHVIVTQEEGQRGNCNEQSHDGKGKYVCLVYRKAPASGLDHDGQYRDGEQVAEKQHRIGVHSVLVERKSEKGVHAVGSSRYGTVDISFGFGIHK